MRHESELEAKAIFYPRYAQAIRYSAWRVPYWARVSSPSVLPRTEQGRQEDQVCNSAAVRIDRVALGHRSGGLRVHKDAIFEQPGNAVNCMQLRDLSKQ